MDAQLSANRVLPVALIRFSPEMPLSQSKVGCRWQKVHWKYITSSQNGKTITWT